jgi:hypothetical protein
MITGPYLIWVNLDGNSGYSCEIVRHVFPYAIDKVLHPLLFFDLLHKSSPQLQIHFGVEVDKSFSFFVVEKELFLVMR